MRSMTRWLTAILFFSIPLLSVTIKEYDTKITLDKNGSYTVEEHIIVNFGDDLHHGIYRDIPVKYKRNGRTYKIRISNISVTDENGKKYRVKKRGAGAFHDDIHLRIGNPKVYVRGVKHYIIKYRIRRGLNFFGSEGELYWNAVGTKWEWPIERARASILLPEGVPIDSAICYTGTYGKQEQNCVFHSTTNRVDFASGYLPPLNGFTIAVRFPASAVAKPSIIQNLLWFLSDNWTILLAFFFFVLVVVVMFYLWLTRGRDPMSGSPVMVRYDPPKGLTPAEVGTVIDERADLSDITSSIIDLAVRGYIRIEEHETKQLFFFKKKDYHLVRLNNDYSKLKPHERELLTSLFKYGHERADGAFEVKTSELKDKFYSHIPTIKKKIYSSLVKEKLFPRSPDAVRNSYGGWGTLLLFIGAGLAMFSGFVHFTEAVFIAAAGVVILLFARHMPVKTRKGAAAALHSKGFQEFVRRAEKDRIERMAKDDPTIFDRLLPYAMALGVGDRWAEAFEGIYREPSNWYVAPAGMNAFSTALLVSSLGDAMGSIGKAMTSTPRSSGGSGGSGFSGGGFSGGGFGGGGGGGW